MESKLERIWNFLNTPFSDLSKKHYAYKYFRGDDISKGVVEVKRCDSKTGELIPYFLMQTNVPGSYEHSG